MNDWEVKVFIREWGKYFPEVEIKSVSVTYYDGNGYECDKNKYEKDNFDTSVRYDIKAMYNDRAVFFEFLAHRYEIQEKMIKEIMKRAYSVYYTELNAVRYNFDF